MLHSVWWTVAQALMALLALDLVGMVGWTGAHLYRATHPPHGLSLDAWAQVRALERVRVGALSPALWRTEVALLLCRAGVQVDTRSDWLNGLHYRCTLVPTLAEAAALHQRRQGPRVVTMHSVMARRRALFGSGSKHVVKARGAVHGRSA